MTRLKKPVKKICEYCGKKFEAGKRTTRCCSGYCSKRAYKDAKRKQVLESVKDYTIQKKEEKINIDFSNRQGYSVAEVAKLLGKCRQTIYNLVHSGKIKAIKVSQRFTIIPQKSIDEFLTVKAPYELLPVQERKPVSDWYTLKEITDKYGIKYRRLRDIINREQIPEKKVGRTTLIAKNRIDVYFKIVFKKGFLFLA